MFQGSIPALVTPMRADGAVDFQAWERLLDFHVAEGTDAVVVGGTTGESPTLEPAEVAELVRRAKARVAGRMPVIAGSGTNSTAKSIELSRELAAAGADGLLTVVPYYNRPTQEGLYRHFSAIADSVDVPVILYNVPGRTVCDMLPETVVRLSEHSADRGHQGGDGRHVAGRIDPGRRQAWLPAAERRRPYGRRTDEAGRPWRDFGDGQCRTACDARHVHGCARRPACGGCSAQRAS